MIGHKAMNNPKGFVFIPGRNASSRFMTLRKPDSPLLESGSESWFLLALDHDLGNIEHVTVQIDCQGHYPAW